MDSILIVRGKHDCVFALHLFTYSKYLCRKHIIEMFILWNGHLKVIWLRLRHQSARLHFLSNKLISQLTPNTFNCSRVQFTSDHLIPSFTNSMEIYFEQKPFRMRRAGYYIGNFHESPSQHRDNHGNNKRKVSHKSCARACWLTRRRWRLEIDVCIWPLCFQGGLR